MKSAIRRGLGIAAVVLIGICMLQGTVRAQIPGRAWHVSATRGNDVTGKGTLLNPLGTIQAAIDRAAEGDTIKVASGTYPHISISDRTGLVLLGGYGPAFLRREVDENPTILNGKGENVVTILRCEGIVLDGFILFNGGTGLYLSESDRIRIAHDVVISNKAGGLTIDGGSDVSILNTFVLFNTYGIGIYAYDGAGILIANNTILGNLSSGIVLAEGDHVARISSNIIALNLSYGIEQWTTEARAVIIYNDIVANGAGAYARSGEVLGVETINRIPSNTGNIEADPLFVNLDFEDPNNMDFHLQPGSPAIDAGDPTRPFNREPMPNGGRVNMGAFGNTPEATTSSMPEGPDLAISEGSRDFGEVLVYDRSQPWALTLFNRGHADLDIHTLDLDPPTDSFGIDYAPLDQMDWTIPPGKSITLTIVFEPQTPGEIHTIVRIQTNDPDEPVVQVKLSGIGMERVPDMALSEDRHHFGAVRVGERSSAWELILFNEGTGDLDFANFALDPEEVFEIDLSDVDAISWSLSPKERVTVRVVFRPTEEGEQRSILKIWTNDPDENFVQVELTGAGTTIPAEEVTFPDPNLKAAIREALNKPEGPITAEDLAGLTELDASERGIRDLSGIEHGVHLEVLNLSGNPISNISPLNSLIHLREVDLGGNQIRDLSPLSSLTTTLQGLYLWNNQISDLRPLSSLRNLQTLGLSGNQISDINPLSSLSSLQELWVANNQISNINPLSRLTKLRELNVSGNQISDIGTLRSLIVLETLDLGDNQIRDLSPLSSLTNLGGLWLGQNQISDIAPLANLTNLMVLYLDDNQIQDIAPLAGLTKIGAWEDWVEERGGVRIDLGLSNNQISNVGPLLNNPGLGEGDGVDLRGNPLSPLALPKLQQLKDRGVKVLFEAVPVPVIVLSEESHNFGDVTVGGRATWELIISNEGTADLSLTELRIEPNPEEGIFTCDYSAVEAANGTLGPGASVKLPIFFEPKSSGPVERTLRILSQDPAHPEWTVSLSGTGLQQDIAVSERTHDFGSIELESSMDWTLTIRNAGTAELQLQSVSLPGGSAFSLAELVRAQTIRPGGTVEVKIRFTPSALGPVEARLTIQSNDPDEGSLQVQLTGTGADTTPATITFDPGSVSEPHANTATQVQAGFSDAGGIAEARLFYRAGGKAEFRSVAMASADGSTFSAEIPPALVTSRGIVYYFQATDVSGNVQKTSEYGLRVAVLKTDRPEMTRVAAYQMLSLPLDAQNTLPQSILEPILGTYDNTQWRLFTYQPLGYVEYPLGDIRFQPGRAFWLITKTPVQLSGGPGLCVPPDMPFRLTLQPGWNMVGNPFSFPIDWTQIPREGKQIEAPWGYDGTSFKRESIVRPWYGYAVKNLESSPVQLFIEPQEAGTSKPALSPLTKAAASGGWVLRLEAQAGRFRDVENYLGVLPDAAEEWDPNEWSEPPPIGEFVSVQFDHTDWGRYPGLYTTDVRPLGADSSVWDFEVATNIPSTDVRLTWAYGGADQGPMELRLVDLSRQTVVDLTEMDSYTFFSGPTGAHRRFRLFIGGRSFVTEQTAVFADLPRRFLLRQNIPNPFNSTTTISFEVPPQGGSDLVTLRILDLLGRTVRTLFYGRAETGLYTLPWDGLDDQGRPVSSGVYLIRMEGNGFSDTKKMSLLR